MAIKITKPGQKEFKAFCKWCGCEFTYEISDLKLSAASDKVSCPTCGKDFHHQLIVPEPTLQPRIDYQWPSDTTDSCAGCVWRENLKQNGLYVGDTPCTWCNKGRFNVVTGKVTANDISVKDYTTPCINPLSTSLDTSFLKELAGTSCKTETEGKITACNCDDTEGHNSYSGEHKCGSKKNCKGCH